VIYIKSTLVASSRYSSRRLRTYKWGLQTRAWLIASSQAVHDELHNLVDESKMGVSAGEDGEAVSSEKVHPASSLNDSPQRMIVLKVREPLDSLDVIYGINPIVLPPNFSQEYPVHRIYKPSLPLYKRTQ